MEKSTQRGEGWKERRKEERDGGGKAACAHSQCSREPQGDGDDHQNLTDENSQGKTDVNRCKPFPGQHTSYWNRDLNPDNFKSSSAYTLNHKVLQSLRARGLGSPRKKNENHRRAVTPSHLSVAKNHTAVNLSPCSPQFIPKYVTL